MAAGDPGRLAALLNAGVVLALAASVVLYLGFQALPAAWLAGLGPAGVVDACLAVLPVCLACSNVAAVAGGGLAGLQRTRTTTLTVQRTTLGGLAAMAVVGLAAAGVHRLDWLLLAYASGLLATAVASWRAVAREIGGLRLAPSLVDRDGLRELATIGGTLQVTTLAAQLGDQGLRLLLGARFGAAAMGTYDLASRAAVAPRSLAGSLLTALVPFSAGRAEAAGQSALADSLPRATRYALLLVGGSSLVGLAVAGPLMHAWLGDAAAADGGARRMFELLLVALAIQVVAGPIVAVARAMGRAVPEAAVTVAAQAASLGAAALAATAVSAVAWFAAGVTLSLLALWRVLERTLDLAALTRADVIRLAAALGGTAAAAAAVRWGLAGWTGRPWPALIGGTLIVSLAWIACAALAGVVTADERAALRRFVRRR
jgi:O-antigen/teichoic acid export membrane protein